MLLAVLLCLPATHGTVKGLGLHGGVTGNIQLFSSLLPGPIRCQVKKAAAQTVTPELLGHMQAGEVPVLAPGTQGGCSTEAKPFNFPSQNAPSTTPPFERVCRRQVTRKA